MAATHGAPAPQLSVIRKSFAFALSSTTCSAFLMVTSWAGTLRALKLIAAGVTVKGCGCCGGSRSGGGTTGVSGPCVVAVVSVVPVVPVVPVVSVLSVVVDASVLPTPTPAPGDRDPSTGRIETTTNTIAISIQR